MIIGNVLNTKILVNATLLDKSLKPLLEPFKANAERITDSKVYEGKHGSLEIDGPFSENEVYELSGLDAAEFLSKVTNQERLKFRGDFSAPMQIKLNDKEIILNNANMSSFSDIYMNDDFNYIKSFNRFDFEDLAEKNKSLTADDYKLYEFKKLYKNFKDNALRLNKVSSSSLKNFENINFAEKSGNEVFLNLDKVETKEDLETLNKIAQKGLLSVDVPYSQYFYFSDCNTIKDPYNFLFSANAIANKNKSVKNENKQTDAEHCAAELGISKEINPKDIKVSIKVDKDPEIASLNHLFSKKTYNLEDAAKEFENISDAGQKIQDIPEKERPKASIEYMLNTPQGTVNLPAVTQPVGEHKGAKNIFNLSFRRAVDEYLSRVSTHLANTIKGSMDIAKQMKDSVKVLASTFGSLFKNTARLGAMVSAGLALGTVYGIGKTAAASYDLTSKIAAKASSKAADYVDRVARGYQAAKTELAHKSVKIDTQDSLLIVMNEKQYENSPSLFKETSRFFSSGDKSFALVKKDVLLKNGIPFNKDHTNIFECKIFDSIEAMFNDESLTKLQVDGLKKNNERNLVRQDHKGKCIR